MNADKARSGAIAAIEIDSSRLLAQAYRKYDPADPDVQARKDACLHTFVDDICAWGQRKSPQGGIGLMVMRDAFAETGAALDEFETQDERLEAAEKQLQAELDAMAQAGKDTRKITQARPRIWIVRSDGTTEPYDDAG